MGLTSVWILKYHLNIDKVKDDEALIPILKSCSYLLGVESLGKLVGLKSKHIIPTSNFLIE